MAIFSPERQVGDDILFDCASWHAREDAEDSQEVLSLSEGCENATDDCSWAHSDMSGPSVDVRLVGVKRRVRRALECRPLTDIVAKVAAPKLWNRNLKRSNRAAWIFESTLRIGARS
jgi:hypothetical protein